MLKNKGAIWPLGACSICLSGHFSEYASVLIGAGNQIVLEKIATKA
jgi:hypothetical protein